MVGRELTKGNVALLNMPEICYSTGTISWHLTACTDLGSILIRLTFRSRKSSILSFIPESRSRSGPGVVSVTTLSSFGYEPG